jgi:hypothetical protein
LGGICPIALREIEADNEWGTADGCEAREPTVTPRLSRWVVGSTGLAGDIDAGRICIVSHAIGYGVAQAVCDRPCERLAKLVAEDTIGGSNL